MKFSVFQFSLLVLLLANSCDNELSHEVGIKERNRINISNLLKNKIRISTAVTDTISGKYTEMPIEELKTRVFRGDLNAYRQLRNALMDSPEDQFFWSFHIANTYDNAQANFDLFYCLLKIYNCDEYKVEKMSINTQTIALEYLLIAAKKGHKQAKEVISDYYPELMKEI
jgi:hypothetical protein